MIRTDSSASTRLRLSARRRPISSATPDSLTSALGALATIAWSRSLTIISRMRTAMQNPTGPFDLGAPDLDRIAVADIVFDRRGEPRRGHFEIDRTGPCTARGRSARKLAAKITIRAAIATARRLTQRSPVTRRPRPQTGRQAGESPSSTSTTAGARDSAPPRHAPDPNRPRPTAKVGRQHADSNPGATYSLPLPLGADGDWTIDCRQERARRLVTDVPVPASLPFPSQYCYTSSGPSGTFNERTSGASSSL